MKNPTQFRHNSALALLMWVCLSCCAWGQGIIGGGILGGGWSPGKGAVLWLDAEKGITGDVSAWADQSAAGNDATQSTPSKQPAVVASIAGLNGHSVVRFDGIDDYLETTLQAQASATMLFVGRINSANDYVFALADGNNRSYLASNGVDKWAGGVGDQGHDVIVSNDDPSAYFYGSLTYDGSTVQLHRNANQEYTGAQVGVVSTTAKYFVGALSSAGSPLGYGNCDVAELIVFPAALTDAQRQRVELYFADKFGL